MSSNDDEEQTQWNHVTNRTHDRPVPAGRTRPPSPVAPRPPVNGKNATAGNGRATAAGQNGRGQGGQNGGQRGQNGRATAAGQGAGGGGGSRGSSGATNRARATAPKRGTTTTVQATEAADDPVETDMADTDRADTDRADTDRADTDRAAQTDPVDETGSVDTPVGSGNGTKAGATGTDAGTADLDGDATPGRSVAPTGEIDRISAIWSAKYWIVLGAALVAILVFAVSSVAPAVYSSSATVSITAASTPGGSAQDVALASNDLAAQDAQLVTTDAVLTAASKVVGVPTSTLDSHVSAGTVAAQNLVQITTQASSPHKAQAWAQALAVAFQNFLVLRGRLNSAALQKSVAAQSSTLSTQIASLQAQIAANSGAAPGSAQFTELESDENQLTDLVTSKATLTSNTALAIASQQPNVDVVVAGNAATKVSPHPSLYALIGGLLALLVGCQLAVVLARRRAVRATAR